MAKYRVIAKMVQYDTLTIDIEAGSEAEAIQIAEETDGGEFDKVGGHDEWYIEGADLAPHEIAVWMEGYRGHGVRKEAECLGTFEGTSLANVLPQAFKLAKLPMSLVSHKDGELKYLGQHIFDNEADARKAHG